MATRSKFLIPVLVTGMLLTGCSNTLLTKFQDKQCVRDCDPKDPRKGVMFEQPVLQSLQMFIGEMGCWIVIGLYNLYYTIQARRNGGSSQGYEQIATSDDSTATGAQGNSSSEETEAPSSPILKAMTSNHPSHPELEGFKILLLALPAICDICGTTLMNVGLLFVAASIYQMTRGALVLFVGLFSVVFLKRHLYAFQWIALFIVVSGVAVVGLAGSLFRDTNPDGTVGSDTIIETLRLVRRTVTDDSVIRSIVGVLLIAFAQIFTATQFVLEEYILEKYAMEPLKVVGYEGLFGFLVTLFGMVVLHFTIGRTDAGRYGYFDAEEGLREMRNKNVWVSSLMIMVSIGAFNFFGISVTRTVSATSRSTIDTCRTLFIWAVSMALGWETFKWLQVVGFGLLVYGTFLFNEIVQPPLKMLVPKRRPGEQSLREEPLLEEGPIEHM